MTKGKGLKQVPKDLVWIANEEEQGGRYQNAVRHLGKWCWQDGKHGAEQVLGRRKKSKNVGFEQPLSLQMET